MMRLAMGALGAALAAAAFVGCSGGPPPAASTDTFTFHVVAVKGEKPGTISDD